jgi:drug/metabolite transporter (DMT)-like permease
MGWILRLEDQRVLRDVSAPSLPPPVAAGKKRVPVVLPPPPPDLIQLLGDSEARIRRRTALAMVLALSGVAVMLGAPGEADLTGDGLAFVAALTFSAMIVITRWKHEVSMAPATCLSQAILVAAFLPFATPGQVSGDDVVWLAALGIGQIGLGFALLTVGARLIPAAQVGLITLLEVVLGPLWVWLFLSEQPATVTLVGGAIVLAAVLVEARGGAAPAAVA